MSAAVTRSKDAVITNPNIPVLYTPRASETTAILAAMNAQPAIGYRSLMNKTVISLKNTPLWSKARRLKFFRLPTLQASLVDWKDTTAPAPVLIGGITHVPHTGLIPDGTTGYATLGFSAASLGLFQDDIATYTAFGAGTGPLFGTVSSSGNLLHAIVSTGGGLTTRVNQTSAAGQSGITLSKNSGHVSVSRSAGSGYSRYHEGLSVGDANDPAQSVSTGVAANEMVLFRQGSAYGSHPISFHGVFSALTAADEAALFQIITAWDEGAAAL